MYRNNNNIICIYIWMNPSEIINNIMDNIEEKENKINMKENSN